MRAGVPGLGPAPSPEPAGAGRSIAEQAVLWYTSLVSAAGNRHPSRPYGRRG